MNSDYIILENIALFLKQGYLINDVIDICKSVIKSNKIITLEAGLESGLSLEEAILNCDFSNTFKEYFKFFILKNDISKAIIESVNVSKTKDNIIKKIKKELTYPMFLIIFLMFFSLFIVFGLLPNVESMFNEFSIKKSIITSILFALFKYLPLVIILLIIIVISLLVISIYAIRKQRFDLIDKIILKVPFVSSILKKYYSIKFAIYYNELLQDGYDTTDIICILNNQMSDSDIKMIVFEIYQEILNGESLEDIVTNFDYFEDIFIKHFRLLFQDTRSGKSISNYIEFSINNLHYYLQRTIKLVVPVVYGFVACFVILVYISIIIPMMDVVSTL